MVSDHHKFTSAQDTHIFILAALVGLMAGATAGPMYFTLNTVSAKNDKYR